jgi:hypothetical protein
MQKTVRKIVEEDINPFVDQWEAAGEYPAKQVGTLTCLDRFKWIQLRRLPQYGTKVASPVTGTVLG